MQPPIQVRDYFIYLTAIIVVVWIFAAFRFYSQRKRPRTKAKTAEDVFIILALACSTTYYSLDISNARYLIEAEEHPERGNVTVIGVYIGDSYKFQQVRYPKDDRKSRY